VVVPAYNEEAALPETLVELRRDCPWADVVVVNDGSADGTEAVAGAFGCRVISLPFNLGIGGAVQTGFQFAAAAGYRVVVQVDADGQHVPGEVGALVAPVLAGACDVAIGSRFLVKGSYRQTFWRSVGIRLLARVISILTRSRVTDPTSGFRAYSREAVAHLATDYPYDYPEPEALIILSRNRFRICEMPVPMRARRDGTSSIGAAVGAKYMFKVLLAIGISMLRPRGPRTPVRDAQGGRVR
jgi:glycosyltransferase involved in cell wall biosynthesis